MNSGDHNSFVMRHYRHDDLESVVNLFYDTVHSVNSQDYSQKQCDVWADGNPNLDVWHRSLSQNCTLVVYDGMTLVGFGNCDDTGYLDRLFVHKNYQGHKIASRICDELESNCQYIITTHASITAQPFFEKRGYQVVSKNLVERNGIKLRNTFMKKTKET
ncbi:MAG: GNAT family N-acetyltransferase [Erysipelothrix sp.]